MKPIMISPPHPDEYSGQDYVDGRNLRRANKPFTTCANASQRAGWKDMDHAFERMAAEKALGFPKQYESDLMELLDTRQYIREDIQLHAHLKDYKRRLKDAGDKPQAEMYAHAFGRTVGTIFRNRELALEQYYLLSKGKI